MSSMANLKGLFQRLTDNTGAIAVNGQVLTEFPGLPGSDAPTYKDAALTLLNTNPIILNAAGKFPFDAFFLGSLRVTTTADNLTSNTLDPFPSTTSALDAFAPWSPLITYNIANIVTGSDVFYYKGIINNNLNNDPTTSPAAWERKRFLGDYASAQTYVINDVVVASDNNFYVGIQNGNQGNDPISSPSFWKLNSADFEAISTPIKFVTPDPSVLCNDTDGVGTFTSNTDILGGMVKVYGDTHGTKPGQTEILSDTTVLVTIDPVASQATLSIKLVSEMDANTLKMRNAGTQGASDDIKISALTELITPTSDDFLLGENAAGDLVKVSAISIGAPNFANDFRISLVEDVPVTTTDVLAAGTLYFNSYLGKALTVFIDSLPVTVTPGQQSLAVPAATDTNFDIFINSGTFALSAVAWSNNTTRATAVIPFSTENALKVQSGDDTELYLTTIRTTGVANQCEDSKVKRFVDNYYNRLLTEMQVFDPTTQWDYTLLTWREANASTLNRLRFVNGFNEDSLSVGLFVISKNSTADRNVYVGLGLDQTTAPNVGTIANVNSTSTNNRKFPLVADYRGKPGIGYRFISWLEQSQASGTTSFFGTDTDTKSGLFGSKFA